MNDITRVFSDADLASLRWAHARLSHPSFAARLSNVIGSPIEQGLQLLPKDWYRRLHDVLELALLQALNSVIHSMERIPPQPASNGLHQFLAMSTGALGGLLGPATLLAELPVTTTMMLRSIADIAHSQGEDLTQPEARLACLQVFALGGRSDEDRAAETGYYGLRITLGLHFSSQILHFTGNTPMTEIPGGIGLIRAIAARFGVVVTDAAAVKLIPVVGAASGAMLSLVFMRHFQGIAQGHFIIRRLERHYGRDQVQAAYEFMDAEDERARHYNPVEGW